MVYQERNLIPYLTGAESICLGLEERKLGVFLNKKRIVEIAQGIRAKTGATVALDVPVSDLSPGQQQMVEILRALIHKPLLLILDEPTASLGTEEIKLLYAVIRELKAQNVAVIIITHKLDEVYEIADTISILRNGEHVVTKPVDQISRAEAVELMLGREIGSQYPEVTPCYKESVVFRAAGISDVSGEGEGRFIPYSSRGNSRLFRSRGRRADRAGGDALWSSQQSQRPGLPRGQGSQEPKRERPR